MDKNNKIKAFLQGWHADNDFAKKAFVEYADYLSTQPDLLLDFKERPGISYSLRAKNIAQKNKDLFVLVDVVDDDPDSRWLSVCFYADMVKDPDEIGDFVPEGLNGENAICFNLDEDDVKVKNYIMRRIEEAAKSASL